MALAQGHQRVLHAASLAAKDDMIPFLSDCPQQLCLLSRSRNVMARATMSPRLFSGEQMTI